MIEPEVISAAQTAQLKWTIPAAISLAQYGLESAWGKDEPPGSNNPFGIKAVAGQPSVGAKTKEYIGGRYVTVTAQFAAYPSLEGAFDAHAQLLATSHYYAAARARLPDANAFAHALTDVYATDPLYGDKLVTLMQEDNLYQYDVTLTLQVEPVAKLVQPVLASASAPAVSPSAPVAIPTAAGATSAGPMTSAPDFSPDPPVQLPSQVTAQATAFGTHWGAALAGFIATMGWIQPSDEAKVAGLGGSLAVLALSIGINALAQAWRHRQAQTAVSVALATPVGKAS